METLIQLPVAWSKENRLPLSWLGRDVLGATFRGQKMVWSWISLFRRMRKCLHKDGFGKGRLKEVLLTGSPWNSISSHIESAEELKKYLNVLQRKKAWNSRNSLSLATTISKGNPGTASLWRRILEIFSEPRSNKEQKWVFVMCRFSLLIPSLHLSGNLSSPQPVFPNDF